MLAFRSLARSVPRLTSQLTARSSRQIQPFRIQSIASPLRQLSPAARLVAPFSSSSRRLDDDALVVKLSQEINVEKDLTTSTNSKSTEQKKAIDDYLTSSGFELTDTPGSEEVVLTKKQGAETIRITFSIADINNEPYSPEEQYEEEQELEEELGDSEAKAAEEGNEAESSYETFPVKLNISISKEGKPGALCVEALTQYGGILIDDFWYFTDGKLPQANSFELQKKRANTYAGPPFGNLDEELQSLIDQYLSDRGVNEALAEFVTDYVDYKEQQEYVKWLENVKNFFE